MKPNVLTLALILSIGAAKGGELFPSGVVPLDKPITIKYAPNFESRCVTKSYVKGPPEFVGKLTTSVATLGVTEKSPGVLYLSISGDEHVETKPMTIAIKADRTGLVIDGLKKQGGTGEEFSRQGDKLATYLIENVFNRIVGKELQTGSAVPQLISCGLLPNSKSVQTSGKYVVLGRTTFRGREVVVIEGEENITCSIGSKDFTLKLKGWETADILSGLPMGSSSITEVSFENHTLGESREDADCTITGTGTSAFQAGVGSKSVEQRLSELKSLRDKGLISVELFNTKQIEILKDL